ncbi:MAG: metallophosphoesterase [Acidobacteria bacterium]|nr:metallophosphoesterase [Acidobacteriota bacterium]
MRHRRSFLAIFLILSAGFLIRAAREPKNDFRFSIMGDRTGGHQDQIFGRVWREVDLLHPDFVINVGDTIEGRGDRSPMDAQWQELRPVWEQYQHYPLYFTPGNHDIWSNESEALYRDETKRPTHYSFNYQDAHFTVLDNSRTTDLTPEQLTFLDADLKANAERRPKFVFFHKPYWISYLRSGQTSAGLHPILKKHNVEHVISGHGHQFVRLPYDGVIYMEVGSSGGRLGGLRRGEGFSKGWFYHHVFARVKGGRVRFTVKEIDGPMGQGRMFRAEDWDAGGPRFDVGDPAITDKPVS